MPFSVQIGPPQICIHQGQTVLISDPDGQINWGSERGLYFQNTRVVSSWTFYGVPWELLNGGPITYYAARVFLTNRSFATEAGIIPPRTLGFTISRWIYGGMHEDLDITNNSMKPVKFQLKIAIGCDFADLFEVKSGNIVRRGAINTEWSQAQQQLHTIYRNGDFSRLLTVSAQRFPKEAAYANGRLSFEVALESGEAWHTCILYTLNTLNYDKYSAPPHEHHTTSRHTETLADWLRTVAKIQTREAVRWLFLAAGKGHLQAEALLGQTLFAGREGVRPQRARGLMWLTLARETAIDSKKDKWIIDLYDKAVASANEDDRQNALAYLENHPKRRN